VINEETAPKAGLGKQFLIYAATLLVAAVVIYGISEFLSPIQPPKQGESEPVDGSKAAVTFP
jgi:hypothetical protein